MSEEKYVLFDKTKKEFVVEEGKTMFLEELVYKTSKNVDNALIFDEKVNVDGLAKELKVSPKSFEWQKAPKSAIEAGKVKELLANFRKTVWSLSDYENGTEIFDKMMDVMSGTNYDWAEKIDTMEEW